MPLPFRDGCQGTHPADSAKDLSGMLSNINLEEMCKNAPERAVGQMQVPFSDGNVQYLDNIPCQLYHAVSHDICSDNYTHTYTHTYIYIYIYI